MKPLASRLRQVIGSALILAFFSEFYSLNEGPVASLLAFGQNPLAALSGLFELAVYYSLFTYPLLICLDHFRVGGWGGLVLAGAVYGLATEALVVPMVYEAMPISLIWTSLSWHTLIDVAFGWYLLRRVMRADRWWPAAALMVAAGGFWGLWATWFWVGDSLPALSLAAFAALAFSTSGALAAGMALADRGPVAGFGATKAEIGLVALASAALFGLTGMAFLPLPLAVLLLLALILLALSAEKATGNPAFLAALSEPPKPARYGLIALLPVTATLSYWLVLATGFRLPTKDFVLLFLAAGTVSFALALLAPLWRQIRVIREK